jgi:hypothetical protein
MKFRALRLPDEVEGPYLLYEAARCGRATCRCARGDLHGPYWYLRFRFWDDELGAYRHGRRYIKKAKLPSVRAWLRRRRDEQNYLRAMLSIMRRAAR